MTLNTAQKDNMEQRREMVAQLRLRMLSMREICAALEKNGIINPSTGRAYDVATIKNDLDVIKAQWQASRNEAMDTHSARQMAELQEIKRAGWAAKEPELVRRTLRDEMDLLGTKKPQELNINVNITIIVQQIIAAAEALEIEPSTIFEAALRRLDAARKLQDANR